MFPSALAFQRMRLSLAMPSLHYNNVDELQDFRFSILAKLWYTKCILYYTIMQLGEHSISSSWKVGVT